MYITASKLFNYIQCQHRVWRDVNGPLDEKASEPNPFVQLLWERGTSREKEVLSQFGEMTDLSEGSMTERIHRTLEEMKKGTPHIYHGLIQFDNMRGEPDLLRKNVDGTYTPVDIKSGSGFEGADEDEGDPGKPKKHYAIQLCLYLEILQRLGFSKSMEGIIYDIKGNEVIYTLNQPMGVRNKKLWTEYYEELKVEVWELMNNEKKNKPALASICKLCQWYDSCKKEAKVSHDLTNIFYVGRGKRDVLEKDLGITQYDHLDQIDIEAALKTKSANKTFLSGIGESTLRKIKQRAMILYKTKLPVVYFPYNFPKKTYELFFDIEDDPTQGIVYLHGVYERSPKGERFIPFVASTNDKKGEKKAWAEFWAYIKSLPKDDFVIYYYSAHEKTTYKKMYQDHNEIVTMEEIENLFSPATAVDLYTDVIYKYTDWPLSSYSLKEIATYIGFKWRDQTPSGALSIQWYNEYLKTKEPDKLTRILEYNEDDCKATMVIKDKLCELFMSKNTI